MVEERERRKGTGWDGMGDAHRALGRLLRGGCSIGERRRDGRRLRWGRRNRRTWPNGG